MDKFDILQDRCDYVMRELGFPEHLIGTQYLKEMIAIYKRGKPLYEVLDYVSVIYNTRPTYVERCARHAIARAYDRGGFVDAWEEIFGASIDYKTGLPSVKEFVARIARVVYAN